MKRTFEEMNEMFEGFLDDPAAVDLPAEVTGGYTEARHVLEELEQTMPPEVIAAYEKLFIAHANLETAAARRGFFYGLYAAGQISEE